MAGSLVIGQNQECYGGCFSPQYQLHGDMAVLRIWDRVLLQVSLTSSAVLRHMPHQRLNLVSGDAGEINYLGLRSLYCGARNENLSMVQCLCRRRSQATCGA